MQIRKATQADTTQLAHLGYLVLFELYNPIANTLAEKEIQIQALERLVALEGVPMSYEFAHVYCNNDEILGAIWTYPYYQFSTMQQKLYDHGQKWNIPFPLIEEEAQQDDYYIDTVSVSEQARRQGIGNALLEHVIKEAHNQNYPYISLIVEQQKQYARSLYEKMGFVATKTLELYGEHYQYMRRDIKKK